MQAPAAGSVLHGVMLLVALANLRLRMALLAQGMRKISLPYGFLFGMPLVGGKIVLFFFALYFSMVLEGTRLPPPVYLVILVPSRLYS